MQEVFPRPKLAIILLLSNLYPIQIPNLTRNLGFGVLETVSKLGSALAPFVVDLAGNVNPGKKRFQL